MFIQYVLSSSFSREGPIIVFGFFRVCSLSFFFDVVVLTITSLVFFLDHDTLSILRRNHIPDTIQ